MLFSIKNQKFMIFQASWTFGWGFYVHFYPPKIVLKKKFEKKKISRENFEIEIFQLFLVPMGSGVSGMDTSNN